MKKRKELIISETLYFFQTIEIHFQRIDELIMKIIQISKKELEKETETFEKNRVFKELILYEKIKETYRKAYKKTKEITGHYYKEPKLFEYSILTFDEKRAKEFLNRLNGLIKEIQTPEIYEKFMEIKKILIEK